LQCSERSILPHFSSPPVTYAASAASPFISGIPSLVCSSILSFILVAGHDSYNFYAAAQNEQQQQQQSSASVNANNSCVCFSSTFFPLNCAISLFIHKNAGVFSAVALLLLLPFFVPLC
jgi:hypothetical protein